MKIYFSVYASHLYTQITDKMFPLPKNRRLVLPLYLVFAVVFPCVENDLGSLLLK